MFNNFVYNLKQKECFLSALTAKTSMIRHRRELRH